MIVDVREVPRLRAKRAFLGAEGRSADSSRSCSCCAAEATLCSEHTLASHFESGGLSADAAVAPSSTAAELLEAPDARLAVKRRLGTKVA